jgi:hypothetical protein
MLSHTARPLFLADGSESNCAIALAARGVVIQTGGKKQGRLDPDLPSLYTNCDIVLYLLERTFLLNSILLSTLLGCGEALM